MFHMYVGVRAGGGIGDQIEDPAGDEYEIYRIIFDITFFFFVIVILLAIIQGLIIDAFGELRDQQEQVKEDMETKCFICGIGNDYFDTVPHGFETHTLQEHNLANYLFFVMYLINKDEHTNQKENHRPEREPFNLQGKDYKSQRPFISGGTGPLSLGAIDPLSLGARDPLSLGGQRPSISGGARDPLSLGGPETLYQFNSRGGGQRLFISGGARDSLSLGGQGMEERRS
ncbi:ryanodine receptor 2-like [Oncorhynchus nerka]|uniref:ryanodine receptor 2-like n=1 Tax=Oncorhynchus nerka TaxID=8023 RepID=UPI0031B83CF9